MDFPNPELNREREYSGRLPLRVPKTLHRAIVVQAEREGLSLNAYANYLLSQHQVLDKVLNKVEGATIIERTNFVDFDQVIADTTTGNVVPMFANSGEINVKY